MTRIYPSKSRPDKKRVLNVKHVHRTVVNISIILIWLIIPWVGLFKYIYHIFGDTGLGAALLMWIVNGVLVLIWRLGFFEGMGQGIIDYFYEYRDVETNEHV